MAEQRSSIISLIKSILTRVCPRVEVTEFIPYQHPDMEHTSEISLSQIATSISNNRDFIDLHESLDPIPISNLLCFESFRNINRYAIEDIFTCQNWKQQVPASTLTAVLEALHGKDCKELFTGLSNNSTLSYNQLFRELHKYTIFPDGQLCVSIMHTYYTYRLLCIVL